jgi:hypothetical protein
VDINKALSMVRKLVERAEHPETSPAEANACRERADALMLKYAIDEAIARSSQPEAERSKPDSLEVAVIGQGTDISGYVAAMLGETARHCRCLVRHYTRYDKEERTWVSTVYGFSHDLRYFEMLYTSLRLHMLGALMPKVNPAESIEANVYRLHNAGFNWLEIARIYGLRQVADSTTAWRLRADGKITDDMMARCDKDKGATIWYDRGKDEYLGNWQLPHKRAYQREIKRRGEAPRKIAANGSRTYRLSAAQGYINMLSQRFHDLERSRKTGSELVLAGSANDLESWFREQNPSDYTRCPRCGKLSTNPYECEFCGQFIKDKPEMKAGRFSAFKPAPFDERAYQLGTEHALTADITPGNKVGGEKKGIES